MNSDEFLPSDQRPVWGCLAKTWQLSLVTHVEFQPLPWSPVTLHTWQKPATYTEMCGIQDVLVRFLVHFLISQSTRCCPSCSLGHRLSPAPPLPPPSHPPLYLQDLSSLFLPCWLTSPRPKECLTLVSGWMWAVPAQKHARLFLMNSSRSGLWASWPAVIGTCLWGWCGCIMGWKQS